jgi:hypothetical protein
MATQDAIPATDFDPHHKRVKSGIRSFIHKRTLSKAAGLSSAPDFSIAQSPLDLQTDMAFLPDDHPHSTPLGELQQNQQSQPSSPKKSRDDGRPNTGGGKAKSLHKKTLSTISLKSLAGRDVEKESRSKEEKTKKPKKTKSSTNLATLLSRPRSTKNLQKAAAEEELRAQKDKENQTPPGSLTTESTSRPPIYAQFSSEYFTTQPLGGKFLEDEIDLYTPQQYSPGKQRNFFEGPGIQPTLGRRDEDNRPKSTYLPSSYSVKDISRNNSTIRHSGEEPRSLALDSQSNLHQRRTAPEPKHEMTMAQRSSKILAAVSALGGSSKISSTNSKPERKIKDVDAEFEAMLVRRNIPENQRLKMHGVSLDIKIDLIKQDWAEVAAATPRPGTNGSTGSSGSSCHVDENTTPISKRPRSRTFTLSRNKDPTSPTKKAKAEVTFGRHARTKSTDSTPTTSKSMSFAGGAAVATSIIAKAKGNQIPDEFVSYLQKVQKPELVEVGKLHKLRLLLRNETVAWTDSFIGLGGMKEIVGLLHRIMEVEWRYVILKCDFLTC